MTVHHTTPSEYGKCRVCQKPILYLWKDAAQTTGQTETFQESKEGNAHHACVGGKSLHELNEERRWTSKK